jgi:hypothetical protein
MEPRCERAVAMDTDTQPPAGTPQQAVGTESPAPPSATSARRDARSQRSSSQRPFVVAHNAGSDQMSLSEAATDAAAQVHPSAVLWEGQGLSTRTPEGMIRPCHTARVRTPQRMPRWQPPQCRVSYCRPRSGSLAWSVPMSRNRLDSHLSTVIGTHRGGTFVRIARRRRISRTLWRAAQLCCGSSPSW